MSKNKISSTLLKDAGNAMKVQQTQLMGAEEQIHQMKAAANVLSSINDRNLSNLDMLLAQAEALSEEFSNENLIYEGSNYDMEQELESISNVRVDKSSIDIKRTQLVNFDEDMTWKEYMEKIGLYANDHSLNLRKDPFATLLSQPQRDELKARVKEDYYAKKPNIDKYDYIIASFCGVAAGLIDSFFVGMPTKSKLGDWTKDETDKFVIKLAKMTGWNPNSENSNKVGHAISFFEGKYKVNYEQATSQSVSDLLQMNPGNHHIKSLSHAPDIFGLIFSIIDQFCSTSHFLDKGRLIVIDTDTFNLRGGNFFAKIFCGFCNWLGHIVSDIAGSSTGRKANPNLYGSGLSIPFFELLQGINVGSIQCGNERKTIAEAAVKMFEEGHDARFGLAMSIPVAFNEFSVRMCWMLKQHYYHKEPWKKCVPIICLREFTDVESNVVVLRRMLLASYGCLCIVDGADAAIRSGGQILSIDFFLHINFIAWKKMAVNLALTGVMEVRLNYHTNHINIKKLDNDLQCEWDELYKQIDN